MNPLKKKNTGAGVPKGRAASSGQTGVVTSRERVLGTPPVLSSCGTLNRGSHTLLEHGPGRAKFGAPAARASTAARAIVSTAHRICDVMEQQQ